MAAGRKTYRKRLTQTAGRRGKPGPRKSKALRRQEAQADQGRTLEAENESLRLRQAAARTREG